MVPKTASLFEIQYTRIKTTQQKSDEALDISLALEESFAEVIDFGPEEDSEETPEEEAIRHIESSFEEHIDEDEDVFVSAEESLPDPPSGFQDSLVSDDEKQAGNYLPVQRQANEITEQEDFKVETPVVEPRKVTTVFPEEEVKSGKSDINNQSTQSADSLELEREPETEPKPEPDQNNPLHSPLQEISPIHRSSGFQDSFFSEDEKQVENSLPVQRQANETTEPEDLEAETPVIELRKVTTAIPEEEVNSVKSDKSDIDNQSTQSADSLELEREPETEPKPEPDQNIPSYSPLQEISPIHPPSSNEPRPFCEKPISFSERASPENFRRPFVPGNMKFSINSYEEREAKETSYTNKLGRKDSTASSRGQPGSLFDLNDDRDKVHDVTRARTLDTKILRNAAERVKERGTPPQPPPKFSSTKEYASLATIPRHSFVLSKANLENQKVEVQQPKNYVARKTSFQASKVVPNDDLVKNQARRSGSLLAALKQNNGQHKPFSVGVLHCPNPEILTGLSQSSINEESK